MGSPSVGASASQRSPPETRTPKTPERSAQPTEIQKGDTMSIFKKSGEGFLAKLFKLGQVEELAEELAHTYADEMQADMLSDNTETDIAEGTAAEPVPMLEVTESGEVDFIEPPETTKGESPPQDTEPSEVRKHLITSRVNDMELEAINRRYAETSFRSRGDFCRYSALTVMNVEEDTEDIKQIARCISSISNSFNQVAHRVNKGGKLYDEDIADMKKRFEEVDGKICEAVSEKKTVSDFYALYENQKKSDYQVLLEQAKAEMENIRREEERQKAEKERSDLRSEDKTHNRNKSGFLR